MARNRVPKGSGPTSGQFAPTPISEQPQTKEPLNLNDTTERKAKIDAAIIDMAKTILELSANEDRHIPPIMVQIAQAKLGVEQEDDDAVAYPSSEDVHTIIRDLTEPIARMPELEGPYIHDIPSELVDAAQEKLKNMPKIENSDGQSTPALLDNAIMTSAANLLAVSHLYNFPEAPKYPTDAIVYLGEQWQTSD